MLLPDDSPGHHGDGIEHGRGHAGHARLGKQRAQKVRERQQRSRRQPQQRQHQQRVCVWERIQRDRSAECPR